MLYAFFREGGEVDLSAIDRQIAAARACGADGIAVLGLGTEVQKLGRDERARIVARTIASAGSLPVAVTIAEGALPDAITAARAAEAAGAAFLVLQPPRPPATERDLLDWFTRLAGSVTCPVAIQNAPEYLGVGLGDAAILQLAGRCMNLVAVKAESSAAALADLVAALDGRLSVLNGRGGLELTDNYRAGAEGMIPGLETVDLQVAIARAMREGREEEAESLYRRLLPAVVFFMQGVAGLVSYGKHIAALRLGIAPDLGRDPRLVPNAPGLAWAARLAAELGPLP